MNIMLMGGSNWTTILGQASKPIHTSKKTLLAERINGIVLVVEKPEVVKDMSYFLPTFFDIERLK
jgi:hypothetical protein